MVISRAVVRDRERQAAVRAAAVEQHGAGAALAVVAALLGAGEAEVLAQRVEQRGAGVELERARLAVDGERDRGALGFHGAATRRPGSAACGGIAGDGVELAVQDEG